MAGIGQTKQRRHENGATAFSDWLRSDEVKNLGLGKDFAGASDLDFIWFPYLEGWYITIEEKCFGCKPDKSQKDTQGILAQHLHLGSERKQRIDTLRGKREIEYRGHYVISFEKTNPNDSDWININGEKKTKHDVIQLLRYGKIYPMAIKKSEPIEEKVINFINRWTIKRLYYFIERLCNTNPNAFRLMKKQIRSIEKQQQSKKTTTEESSQQTMTF